LWLSFCAERQCLGAAKRPSDRINKATVTAYIADLRPRVAPRTVTNIIVALKVMAKAMEPGKDWRWLELISNALNRTTEPQQDKLTRMRPLNEVVDAAVGELEKLAATPLTRRADRIGFRDALMLALIALRPLRIKNFANLQLDRHLRNLRSDHAMIAIPAEEVKNKIPLDYTYPALLLNFTLLYLDRVRPTFRNANSSDALWVAYNGTPISINEARLRIKLISKKLLGVDINPHLFRDIGATDIAEFQPEGIFTAAALLGHKNETTTERFYIRARRVEASKRLNEALAARRALRRPGKNL
jgi:integrase